MRGGCHEPAHLHEQSDAVHHVEGHQRGRDAQRERAGLLAEAGAARSHGRHVDVAHAPEQALLAFFQSTYDAGATLGQWDRQALERGMG